MSHAGEPASMEELEKRVARLEGGRWEKWAQSAIVPIVLLLLGGWVNSTLQKGNAVLEQTRVTSQQVDVAQKMLASMFDGNPTKAFATARLMRKVVDSLISREVDSVLTAYYAEKVRASVEAGQLDTAAAIVAAAQAVGGAKSGNELRTAVGNAGATTVQSYVSRTDSARALEKSGFEALGRGDIAAAYEAFRSAERIYPGYHISFEMALFLRKAGRDPAQVSAVLQKAIEKFGRFMPPETVRAIRVHLAADRTAN